MGQVIWAPSAIEDADSIAAYIARDSVEQASLFITRLLEATDRLREFPMSGRDVPEIGDQASREVICGSYRIMYRLKGKNAWIVAVVHGARDWAPE